jgi:hypothetical protein
MERQQTSPLPTATPGPQLAPPASGTPGPAGPPFEAAPAGPGPEPGAIDELAWASIEEIAQRKQRDGARALSSFVRDTARAHATPKGDPRTNVIDQGARATYALGREPLRGLFRHLEACRLEGSVAHWSERQGTPAAPRCGLMLDFDLVVPCRRPALADRHYNRIAGSLVAALQRDIDFAAQLAVRGEAPAEARLHVFFTIKPEALPCAAPEAPAAAPAPPAAAPAAPAAPPERAPGPGAGGPKAPAPGAPRYKYGLHVLVPGVQLGRAYKKWLYRQFRADPSVLTTLRELGAADPEGCLDQNSASVPVLFFGSCKRGAVPYVLGAALEVTADLACGGGPGAWVPPPGVRRLDAKDLAGYNLAAELCLTAEAEYDDGREPLVRKREYELRPEVAAAAQDWGERCLAGAPAEELVYAEHELAALTLADPEARHLHALLGLLGGEFLTDRNRWRDVVYALAGTSETYRPLAVWYSQRCRHRTRPGSRADEVGPLWDEALARRASVGRPLTARSIDHWAREADPARYAEVKDRSYFTTLAGYVYEHGGRLQHYMCAKVLHQMLGAKFCVDSDGGRGGLAYSWWEFVLPGQPMVPGEVWKWRREAEPDNLHIYMSDRLARALDQVGEHLDERLRAAADERQAQYYKGLAKAFAGSRLSLHNDTFKNGVIRQAHYLFRRRGFARALDAAPDLLGTLNGVLRLGPRLELVDRYHEHPVSLYTPVAWRPFDPAAPWTRLLLRAVADIIPEPDARDWILFHAAQGLSSGAKEGVLLLWDGGGQNGKTSFLRWVAKALGPYADKFNVQLLCCGREDADRPNSAVMRFKRLNYAYAEETLKAQTLNVARMKELVNAGEISSRELNCRQETFTIHCNFVVASQYGILVPTTDHGTWRRIVHYTSKVRFSKNPDPANPLEKPEDQRFVRAYPDDPCFQEATFSLLGHYYERLQNEYGGELKNVPAPTLQHETRAFRVSQDALHRWVCEAIVRSPAHEAEYPLPALSSLYVEWYARNIDRKHHAAGETIKDLASSAISKYLHPAPNRTLVLRGCRVLTADEPRLRPDEELLDVVEMRGRHSAEEWAAACSAADAPGRAGDAWWAARGTVSRATPAHAAEALLDPGDEEAVLRAGCQRLGASAPRAPPLDLSGDDIADLAALVVGGAEAGPLGTSVPKAPAGLAEATGAGPVPAGGPFGLDDLYLASPGAERAENAQHEESDGE